MKADFEKILEPYLKNELLKSKVINELMVLTILKKDDVETCPICEEYVLIHNTCPKCTIELCTPFLQEPRYFVDIRAGCGAVRDRLHESYNKYYQGLHYDLYDVVEYKHGVCMDGYQMMKDEDVKYLYDLCERLNKEN